MTRLASAGVGVVVLLGDKILLVKRRVDPQRGKWSIPAGYLDYGEDPRVTAEREVLEETNLKVSITGLVDVYYNAESLDLGGASIFILYRAKILGGQLRAGDDADDRRAKVADPGGQRPQRLDDHLRGPEGEGRGQRPRVEHGQRRGQVPAHLAEAVAFEEQREREQRREGHQRILRYYHQ